MESYWIWNYGDYEIFHANKVNSRRQEYGADYPCFWRMHTVEPNIKFESEFTAEKDGELTLHVNGIGYIVVDCTRYPANIKIPIEKGKHGIGISVTNLRGLPAAYIESDVCSSGKGWFTVDENSIKTPAGYEKCYNSPSKNPEVFPFEYETMCPITKTDIDDGILFDFGKEIFGFLNVYNTNPNDNIHVSYGESKEEATDTKYSVVFEDVSGSNNYKLRQRAFRYIFITGSKSAEISADYEYLPLEYKGSFECDDEDVNKIWNMCAYTLHLTTREVQLEAIKRDRWLWGGDAYQAYKFSNYLFFDKEIIRRSTIALRGKDPVKEHINTITDYSFYWVIGLYEYYLNHKDIEFIKFIYPRAVSLMEYSGKRVNNDGFITKVDNDWIFIDWSDIDKDGALCAEQMLFIEANRAMARLAKIIGENGEKYLRATQTYLPLCTTLPQKSKKQKL